MKKILSNLDTVGIIIFSIILVNFLFLYFERVLLQNYKWENFDFGLLILVLGGFLVVFKPVKYKGFSLILSILCLILISNQFDNILYFFTMLPQFVKLLPHMIATNSIKLSEISYYFLLPIIVATYCIFRIINKIVAKHRENLH